MPQIYKLGSYKVDQIKKEETRLAEDNVAVVGQTQDLAISNYKTFIQTSECSRRIYTEFKETEQQLNRLIEKLPSLTGKCEKFIKTSSEIATSRRLNSLTLRRNAQLLEILELPQLMDTCIYQGKYEEALELAAHVQRMGAKHGGIPAINVSLFYQLKNALWINEYFEYFTEILSLFRILWRQLKDHGIRCSSNCWPSFEPIYNYRNAFKLLDICDACKLFHCLNSSSSFFKRVIFGFAPF